MTVAALLSRDRGRERWKSGGPERRQESASPGLPRIAARPGVSAHHPALGDPLDAATESAQAPGHRRQYHFAHIHPSITIERVTEAVERELTTLDDPGFCLACGAEAEGVEPDAEYYTCESCGEPAVYGAAEILIAIA